MKSTFFRNIVMLAGLGILSSCSILSLLGKNQFDCIPPAVKVAYPAGLNYQLRGQKLPTITSADVPPVYPWKEISHNPDRSLTKNKIELIRSNHNLQEIWVSVLLWPEKFGTLSPEGKKDSLYISKPESVTSYMIFLPRSGEWVSVGVDTISRSLEMVLLFEDKAENIWGIGKIPAGTNGKFVFSLFKYDEKNRQLIPAEQSDIPEVEYSPDKMIGPDEIFWFVERDNSYITSLYKFDLVNRTLERYDSIIARIISPEEKILAPFLKDIQVDQNGYLIIKTDKSNDLIYFQPDAGHIKLENINVLSYADYGMSKYFDVVGEGEKPGPGYVHSLGERLFLDLKGNLWVDDYGWKEPGGEGPWYKNIRLSPDFIRSQSESGDFGPYVFWDRPHPVLNSRDGMMWFIGIDGGLSRFDPNTGEWCKMTTMFVNSMAEDNEGNLWTLAGNSLYWLEKNN